MSVNVSSFSDRGAEAVILIALLCVSQGIRGIEGNMGGPGLTGPRVRLNFILKLLGVEFDQYSTQN